MVVLSVDASTSHSRDIGRTRWVVAVWESATKFATKSGTTIVKKDARAPMANANETQNAPIASDSATARRRFIPRKPGMKRDLIQRTPCTWTLKNVNMYRALSQCPD